MYEDDVLTSLTDHIVYHLLLGNKEKKFQTELYLPRFRVYRENKRLDEAAGVVLAVRLHKLVRGGLKYNGNLLEIL